MTTPLLIVLAGIGLVIGSIFWLLPSPAERRRMRLRQVALERGFKVKSYKPEDIDEVFEEERNTPLPEDSVKDWWGFYYYFKPAKFEQFNGKHVWCLRDGQWQKVKGDAGDSEADRVAEALIPDLSFANILVLGRQEVGFYWNEQLSKEQLTEALGLFDGL